MITPAGNHDAIEELKKRVEKLERAILQLTGIKLEDKSGPDHEACYYCKKLLKPSEVCTDCFCLECGFTHMGCICERD